MSGIYAIRNEINGKVYIGSTKSNFSKRFARHRYLLKNGKHDNNHLQHAWNKYGEDNFTFRVVDSLPEDVLTDELIKIEQFYLDVFFGELAYNLRQVANSNAGLKKSEETKARMRGHKRPHAKELMRNMNRKTWCGFVSPNGTVYKSIEYMGDFCREHNLSSRSMRYVATGRCKQHRGWKKLE